MSIYYQQGLYRCIGIGQGFNESSTGTPQFLLNFKVMAISVNGEYESLEQQYDRTSYMALTANTQSFVVEGLRRLGFDGASLTLLNPTTANFHDFAGQEFEMWCKHDSYNGKPNEKWSPGRGASEFKIEKPLEAKKLRDLDNLFGKALKATGAPASNKLRPVAVHDVPQPQWSEPITDDDVPF
jgi:hypothetical protein